MIAKITRGSGFRGATRYALDRRPGLERAHQPEIIGGNMAGRTSWELTREFEAIRRQRPDIQQPVEHVSLNFQRADRPLSNEEMARIAEEYVGRRGYDPERCQYVVIRHRDKDYQHCHILLNRVRTDPQHRGSAIPRVPPQPGGLPGAGEGFPPSAGPQPAEPLARMGSGADPRRGEDAARSRRRQRKGTTSRVDP